MLKRTFILLLIILLGLCFTLEAQAQGKFKVGIVKISDRLAYLEGQEGILSGFKKEGFDESRVEFYIRSADENPAKFVDIAKELREKKVDLIITLGTDPTVGMFKEVKDIPIVFSQTADPVASGFAKSLESSGMNTTGTTTGVDWSVIVKTLREVSPAKRLGVLYSEGDSQSLAQKKEVDKLQAKLGFIVVPAHLKTSEEAADVVGSLVGRIDSIYITGGSTIGRALDAIVEVVTKYKIPSISQAPDRAEKGILLAVGPSRIKLGELAVKKAIEVLNGKKPSEIPIEPLRQYDIIVNLKSAEAMGIKIPVSLLKVATRVIK